jgi:hypothetical protein
MALPVDPGAAPIFISVPPPVVTPTNIFQVAAIIADKPKAVDLNRLAPPGLEYQVMDALGSMLPGKGEVGDFELMTDEFAPVWARMLGTGSLGLNVMTAGMLPNISTLVKGGAIAGVLTRAWVKANEKFIRLGAGRIWARHMGREARSMGLIIHHRIPLQFAHLFPDVDPNSVDNLVGIVDHVHFDIHAFWTMELKALGGAPTPQDIQNIAASVDVLFPEMVRIPH